MADESAAKSPSSPTEETAPKGQEVQQKAEKGKKEKFSFSALSPKDQLLSKIAGFSVFIMMMDMMIIRPAGNHLKQLNEGIKEQKEVTPKKLLILKYKDQIFDEYKELASFMTDVKLSEEEEIAQLLSEIERISKQSTLFVSNINPVERNKVSEETYELTVNIEGMGKMSQLIQFIQSLETESPPMRIRTFTMTPKEKGSEDIKFLFTVVKLGVRKKLTEQSSS